MIKSLLKVIPYVYIPIHCRHNSTIKITLVAMLCEEWDLFTNLAYSLNPVILIQGMWIRYPSILQSFAKSSLLQFKEYMVEWVNIWGFFLFLKRWTFVSCRKLKTFTSLLKSTHLMNVLFYMYMKLKRYVQKSDFGFKQKSAFLF